VLEDWLGQADIVIKQLNLHSAEQRDDAILVHCRAVSYELGDLLPIRPPAVHAKKATLVQTSDGSSSISVKTK
jgi:hypothetical protein